MEKGLIYAIFAALCFAAGVVYLRRGTVQAGESYTGVLISVFVGVVLFPCVISFTAEWSKLWSLSWQGLMLLAIAGILHFVVGRLLFYSSVRRIGANRSSTLVQTNPFYAVILGILFLHEPLTVFIIPGVLCITTGVTLVSLVKEERTDKMQGKGILFALGSALCWGISGVLVKPAIEEIGASSAAAFVSHFAALPVLAGFLFRQEQREQLFQLNRASLVPLVISGILAFMGQFLRFKALMYSPVSVVIPLISTNVLFVFLLSFFLNRNIEVFTRKVLIGVVAVIVGVFLFFQ